MVTPAHRKKAKKRRKKFKGADKNMPEFKPEWINAFVITMLHKIGGVQALTLDQLKMFDEVDGPKEPDFLWSAELQAFTLKAPEYDVPAIQKPPKLKIVT